MKSQKIATSILLLILFVPTMALCQTVADTQGKQTRETGSLSEYLFGKSSQAESTEKQSSATFNEGLQLVAQQTPASAWQTSWDAFLTLGEQELNRLPPNAPGPWEGKEVTWEGTVQDMEIMTAKNLVRLVFDMPARTLSIQGKPVTASTVMIFVPMNYENMGGGQVAFQKGTKVRFKTTIAPLDANHRAVSAQTNPESGKGFLLIFTKGGTILK
jgi:hypothetical protein